MRSWFSVLVCAAVPLFASAASADTFGYVYCASAPAGAVVSFDDIDSISYETPFMRALDVGDHRATLVVPGYTRKKVSFHIAVNEVTRVTVDFSSDEKTPTTSEVMGPVEWETGKLTILTDRQADVTVDGSKQEQPSPVTLEKIKIGRHDIALEHNGETFTVPVNIKGGEVNKIEVLFDSSASPRGILWPRPTVTVHLRLDLPKCDYRVERNNQMPDTMSRFHGVDNVVQIHGLENNLTLASRFFTRPAQFQKKELSGIVTGGDTVVTRDLEVPIDSLLQFEFRIFPNPDGRFRTHKEVTGILKRHSVAASFNNGREVNVRVEIQPDGDLIFRYW